MQKKIQALSTQTLYRSDDTCALVYFFEPCCRLEQYGINSILSHTLGYECKLIIYKYNCTRVLFKNRHGNDKTEVATFRMPESTLQKLKKEAKDKRLTVNALMNQIVSYHNDFYSLLPVIGMMPFSKNVLHLMMNSLDESKIRELSQLMAKRELVDLVYMKEGKYTMESLLDALLIWSMHSGFAHHESDEGGQKILTIQHNMGEKWSLFMISCLLTCFGELTDKKITFEKSEDMVVIQIGDQPST